MKLSILIPTLESRKTLKPLVRVLIQEIHKHLADMDCCHDCDTHQIHYTGYDLKWIRNRKYDVEIMTLRNNGERNIGYYRQCLLEQATGDYIAFIDDDDMVPDDYISKILTAIETEPDCCSLTGEIHWLSNGTTERFEHSLKYDKWEKKDGVYLRYPNHLNAVRRELALQVGFKDMGHGEDRDYSDRLKPLLKTEAPIDGVIYHYNCRG